MPIIMQSSRTYIIAHNDAPFNSLCWFTALVEIAFRVGLLHIIPLRVYKSSKHATESIKVFRIAAIAVGTKYTDRHTRFQ